MPKWYFSKERLVSRTPSRLNGVDFDTECRYRREGCRFIMDMGNKLGLRYDTMATGVMYFHRFYMKQSFKTFPRWVTACACLFLAGKVEETPKKCRDIIKVAKNILSDHHFQLFGENPREEVMMYERVLLQTIKFDLQVDHPYAILLKIGKLLKGDKGKVQKLVQMAWTFVNDSLSTNLCLRRRPEILAIAHLNLAGKLASFDLKSCTDSPPNKPWWLVFNKDCQETVIEEICDEMLELYGGKKKEKLKTKEKMNPENIAEPSPNNSSSTSSPSVTNSPPFKKKRITNSKNTETRKSPSVLSTAGTSASQSDPVVTKCLVPPPPLPAASNLSVHVTASSNMSCVEPPLVENISPAVTSDALPTANQTIVSRTMSYTIPLNAASVPNNVPNIAPVPCVPMPPRIPTGSFVNHVAPHNSFLSGTYSTAPYGIISQGQGVESIGPTSTNSSFLPPTAQVETLYAVPPNAIPVAPNPSGFRQTFPNIPPPSMPSHQLSSQPPPQPHQLYPTHLQPPPQQNVPPMPLPPHMMNSQRPSAMPGNNNQNWHSLYNRPPNNQPMGGGGWLR